MNLEERFIKASKLKGEFKLRSGQISEVTLTNINLKVILSY